MGIRPNKTNFSLSFGDFGRVNVKRRREEEEKKKRKKRRKVWKPCFCMDISGSISRV